MGTTSQKLTYLNDTKTKIRYRINSLGGSLDSDDTFRSYADELESLYNDMPKVSESDVESASLSPTQKGAMAITYKGQTQQDSTPTPSSPQEIHNVSGDNTIEICGKNIANLIRTSASYTGSGTQFSESQYFVNMTRDSGVGSSVTLTSATNDTIVVKGRYNQGIGFPRKCKPNTYYSLQATSTSADARVYMSFFDNTGTFISGSANDTSMQRTQQSPANAYWVIPIFAVVGSTLTDTTFTNIMLEESDTATTYEAFTGQTQLISLGYTNMLDIRTLINNKGLNTSNGKDLYDATGYSVSQYIKIRQNVDYSITNNSNDTATRVYYYDENQNFLSTERPVTTINSATATYIRLQDNTSHFQDGYVIKETGVTPIELCKIGNYQDYFYKTDKWYLHKEIGKVVLNGSETGWTYTSVAQGSLFRNNIVITNAKNDKTYTPYSNNYKGITENSYQNRQNNQFYLQATSGFLDIIDNRYTNTTDFKTWLSTHNTIVYYVLATPTDTEITDTTLLEQLETIKRSYDGVTNINQENNDLPFILDVSALKEWE